MARANTLLASGTVKLLCQRIWAMSSDYSFDLDSLALFGENMFGIHSIEYDNLESFFYLFGVRRHHDGAWLSWDDVVAIANELEIPTVPLLYVVSHACESCSHTTHAALMMPSGCAGTRHQVRRHGIRLERREIHDGHGCHPAICCRDLHMPRGFRHPPRGRLYRRDVRPTLSQVRAQGSHPDKGRVETHLGEGKARQQGEEVGVGKASA